MSTDMGSAATQAQVEALWQHIALLQAQIRELQEKLGMLK